MTAALLDPSRPLPPQQFVKHALGRFDHSLICLTGDVEFLQTIGQCTGAFMEASKSLCQFVRNSCSVEETSHSSRRASPRVHCEATSRKCIVICPHTGVYEIVAAARCVPHFPNSILTPCHFIEKHGIGVSRCLSTVVSTFLTSLSTSRLIVNFIHKCISQQIKSLTNFSTCGTERSSVLQGHTGSSVESQAIFVNTVRVDHHHLHQPLRPRRVEHGDAEGRGSCCRGVHQDDGADSEAAETFIA